jgi:hypothetical protein
MAGVAQTAAKCHKETHAAQQLPLFNHLVSAGERRGRNGQAERSCGLEVDHQLDFGSL